MHFTPIMLHAVLVFGLFATSAFSAGAEETAKPIDVTYDNYNQAETARNFNNWAKMGGNNEMAHRKELSPIGPNAPTIRMNLDTLYSVGVFNNDGAMTLTLPATDVYQSAMIIDTDGYTPYFFVEPGTYTLTHDSEYLFIAVRTGVKNRHSKASFEEAYKAQEGVKVEGHGKEHFKLYPLSKQDNPPAMNFINVSGKFHNTIHRMDDGFWEELNETIQAEPLEGLDPDLRGLIASIGIEKGKEFAPDERMKKILTEAAKVGSVTARALTARPRDERHYLYPGKRQWTNPFIQSRYDFLLDGTRLLDSRTYMHFYATGITPAMAVKNVGKGSQYLIAYLDKDGNAFDGSKTYKMHLPPNIPAKDFWSFTLYDNQTRSMLQTDQRFPGLSSIDATPPQLNADGSYDVYFGPKAPEGKQSNWLQTVPGKGWNAIFRVYGPLEAYYDQSWMPGDFELVE